MREVLIERESRKPARRGVVSRKTPGQANSASRKAEMRARSRNVSPDVLAERQRIVDELKASPPKPTWFHESSTDWRYCYR